MQLCRALTYGGSNEGLMTRDLMQNDWDARAKENAMYYIVTNAAESEEQFRASADQNMRELFEHIWPLLERTGSVLEIGCGIGRLLVPLTERFDRVLGCDVSPEMIRMAADYLKDQPKIHVWTNDGLTLDPLKDGEIDFVYSYITFQHIPDRSIVEGYVRESYRVLAPGGIFYYQVVPIYQSPEMIEYERTRDLSTWIGYHWEEEDAIAMTTKAGFEILRSQRIQVAENYDFLFVTARKPH